MGSIIEINDTLKISKDRGLPKELNLEDHTINHKVIGDFLCKEFFFWNEGARLYNRPPSRVFLVEEMSNDKWLYWGHALIKEQTITENKTNGIYTITKIYNPEYQRLATINESPRDKSYF